jgi:hypothetical protein
MNRPPRDKTPLPSLDDRDAAHLFDPTPLTEEEQHWWAEFIADVTPLNSPDKIARTATPLPRARQTHAPASMDRLDLHGMHQQEAFMQLAEYLQQAQTSGYRHLTVITGQGRKGQGILKQSVPRWLEAMSPWVEAWEHAAPKEGGQGALKIRIRRKGTSHV